jgi:hypothetical protein
VAFYHSEDGRTRRVILVLDGAGAIAFICWPYNKIAFAFERFRLHSTSQQARESIAERVAVLILLWLV